MSNFSPKLQDSTEDQLLNIVNELNPNYGALASDEPTRRSVNQLNQSIKNLDHSTGRYNQFLIALTWVILLLTVVAVVANFSSIPLRIFFISFFSLWSILVGIIIFKKKTS